MNDTRGSSSEPTETSTPRGSNTERTETPTPRGSSGERSERVETTPLTYDAIVLAGGTGARLGGVDKARLEVGGVPLLVRVLSGLGRARRVVIVAPSTSVAGISLPTTAEVTLEDPPGGGPVAGLVAGMSMLADDPRSWTLVAAVDQPGAVNVVPALVSAAATAGGEVDAVCHHDDTGYPQWLLALYRSAALRSALAPYGTGHDVSVRRVVSGLRFGDVVAAADQVGDIDTWQDHQRWQERLTNRPEG